MNRLLNEGAALGVGLVDDSGLVVHSSGAHDGQSSVSVGAHLASFLHSASLELEQLCHETFDEQVMIGATYSFYLYKLPQRRYLLYVMVPKDALGAQVRRELRRAGERLLPLLRGNILMAATRQRLEQPRQFASSVSIR